MSAGTGLPDVRIEVMPSGEVREGHYSGDKERTLERAHPSFTTLTPEIQRKVAVLNTLSLDSAAVFGVGRRMAKNIFWIYLDGQENDDANSK